MNTTNNDVNFVLRRRVVAAVVSYAAMLGCSSPNPQSGTNTNWGTCISDAECAASRKGAICVNNTCELPAIAPRDGGPPDGPFALPPVPSGNGGAPDGPPQGPFTPLGNNGNVSGIATTDTGWIAVGYGSFLNDHPLAFASTDAQTWTPEEVPAGTGGLFDVAFGNGTIVALGPGHIVTKPPGGQWQAVAATGNPTNVIFGNGRFLATAGTAPAASTSTDGINWTPIEFGAAWVTFLDGQFVGFSWWFLGTSATTTGFRTSPDGITWTDPVKSSTLNAVHLLSLVGADLFGIAYGTGDAGFDALGPELMLSGARGTPLTELTITPSPWASGDTPQNVAASPTLVVAMARSKFYTTPLPIGTEGWSSNSASNWQLWDIAHANGMFVAVGSRDEHPIVTTSTDGLHWQEIAL